MTDVLKKANISITAMQETKYPGKNVIQCREYAFYYSGNNIEKNREFGTGFVVLKQAMGAVIGFNPINERLCTLRVRGKFFNITLINAHAPTEDKDDEIKDVFYEKLRETYNKAPSRDIKVVLGDFNAKVGKEPFYRPTIGQHSLHSSSNRNGCRLIDFAVHHNMVVASTYFPHKSIHMATWISPDGRTANQIDHVLIDGRHRNNILDVRSCRGPNIDSDHMLVRLVFRARIDARRSQQPMQRRYNVEKLSNTDIVLQYEAKMEERLQQVLMQGTPISVDDSWNQIRQVVTEVADEVIGKKCLHKRNDWFDLECKQVLDAKNEARSKYLHRATRATMEDYRNKRTVERKLFRKKKKELEQRLIAEIQLKSSENDTRGLYQRVKKMKFGYNQQPLLCKDANGAVLADEERCIIRWTEYFKNLLNQNEANTQTYLTRSQTTQQFPQPYIAEPSIQEVRTVVKNLKNNKSPGTDNIPGELLKHGGEALLWSLHRIIVLIWREEELPVEWKLGIICPLYKKGDKLDCTNYRGITLLNIAYKIFANVLYQRLLPYANENIGEYQCGFRNNRSTTDQLFGIRQIMEKCREFNVTTHHLFVDFKAAYDSVKRSALWSTMEQFGFPHKLIALAKLTLSSVTSKVRIRNRLSDAFNTEDGLRQGDPLATLLFNIALEKAVRCCNVDTCSTIYRKSSMLLAYADDVDIIGRNVRQVKETFVALRRGAAELGLKVNEDKTKYMVANASEARTAVTSALQLTGNNFEGVDRFVYLGSLVNNDNDTSEEVRRRITLGNRCFYSLHKFFRSKVLSWNLKCTLYRALVRPVAVYGSESWSMTQREEQSLRSFERQILRVIFGAIQDRNGWRRRMNFELDNLFGGPDIVRTIKIGRLRWLGHMQRMDSQRIPRKLFEGTPDGKRSAGRPRHRWKDNVLSDLNDLKVRDWRSLAENRSDWRSLLEEAKTAGRL